MYYQKILSIGQVEFDCPIDIDRAYLAKAADDYVAAILKKATEHAASVPQDFDAFMAACLHQYYTDPAIIRMLRPQIQRYIDPLRDVVIEPGAGDGAFLPILPAGTIAFDVCPRLRGIIKADFLKVTLPSDRRIVVVGNPPFGKNASLAKCFFNHAASQASVIMMILPRSFRKASVQNRLHRNFHLKHEQIVPARAFLFRGKPYNVPAVFQIWQRQEDERALRPTATSHPDFRFTTDEQANFAIQRVGANAGCVHHRFYLKPSAHYFIAADPWVERIMRRLNLAVIAADTAGNPSIAKSEIVAAYRAKTGR